MIHFKTKDYSKPERIKTLYGGGKKQSEENIIKNIKIYFKLKKQIEAIKDRITRDVRTHFKQDDYYEPIRLGNFLNNNYIEYKNNGDRNKNLSVKE